MNYHFERVSYITFKGFFFQEYKPPSSRDIPEVFNVSFYNGHERPLGRGVLVGGRKGCQIKSFSRSVSWIWWQLIRRVPRRLASLGCCLASRLWWHCGTHSTRPTQTEGRRSLTSRWVSEANFQAGLGMSAWSDLLIIIIIFWRWSLHQRSRPGLLRSHLGRVLPLKKN